jgi:cytidyltransferase-like protein
MIYKYKLAAFGGTFDHLHIGHKKFIDTAFSQSKKLIIGITTQNFNNKKHVENAIQDLNARKNQLVSYLSEKNFLSRADIVFIDDIYGPTINDPSIQAIFVTDENATNAEKINEIRRKKGLSNLKIELIKYYTGDDQKIVASSLIRRGTLDRHGRNYFNLFAAKKEFVLWDEDRNAFKKPIGRVLKKIDNKNIRLMRDTFVIAVGDIAVLNLFKKGVRTGLGIVDHRTRRSELDSSQKAVLEEIKKTSNILTTDNKPGTIERRAVGVIRKALSSYLESNKKQLILVSGEEDLMVIPAVLLSPLESLVVYGQPDRGLVIVKITEKKKKEVEYLFSKLR